MGGVGSQADVVDEIVFRHDGQPIVEQHAGGKNTLEVWLSRFLMFKKHGQQALSVISLPNDALQAIHCFAIIQKGIAAIPLLHDAAP